MTVGSIGSNPQPRTQPQVHPAHTQHRAHQPHHHTRTGHSTRDTFTPHTARASGPAGVGPQMTQAERVAAVRQMADQARAAGVPPELPVMTALVESRFQNLNYGDRDSLGMFQQRAAWGSAADRTNIQRSTDMFLNGGAGGQRGAADYIGRYGSLPVNAQNLGRWAQRVQGSAYPDRYQAQFDNARALLHEAGVAGY